MPPFGWRAPKPDELAAYVPKPPQLRVLRAAGQRIDLSARDTAARLAATKQSWQQTAFDYRTLIGEIREAHRLRAQAVAKCRFYVAEKRPWPEPPIPLDTGDHHLDKQLAADAIVNFNRIPFDPSPDGFTARLDENLNCVGEAWIHIDADDVFHVRSISEVQIGSDGRIAISTLPGMKSVVPIDPDREALLRCWVQDLEWSELADAPMRSMLGVAEDVVLTGREMRAGSRSRVAANGILLVPTELSLVRSRDDEDDGDGDGIERDTFMQDFVAAMLAPLDDDGDAQQVVPIVIRGDKDALDGVKHITLQRADAEKLIDRQQAALVRLLQGLDVQPEQIEGVGDTSHWNAWQIDARSIKEQVQPAADTIAACMVKAFMRPALESLGYTSADINRITIIADASDLAENPNRGQDARDAHDRLVISDAALRRELGFSEDDAPNPDEITRRLASSGRLPPQETAEVLGLRRPEPRTVDGQVLPRQARQGRHPSQPGQPGQPAGLPAADGDRPVATPGQVTPNQQVPEMPAAPPDPSQGAPAPGLRAAADPDEFAMHVDEDACRALAAIDASLMQRIWVAADDALARVLERAGARVRSAAQRDRALAAQLVNRPAAEIPALLGRDKVAELVQVTDLITDEYARLRGQVTGWLRDAAVEAGMAACDVLGVNPHSPLGQRLSGEITSRLAGHVDPAWQVLLRELHEAAEWALFEPSGAVDDEPGEQTASPLTAQDIADVLAVAGGDQLLVIAASAADHADVDVDAFARGQQNSGGWKGKRRSRRPDKKRRPRTNPGTGLATGPVVQQALADEGAVLVGWEWDYRPHQPRKTFEPHRRLHGVRFSTWTDPKLDTDASTAWLGRYFHPGDHKGCLCGSTPIFAVLDDPEGIVARRLAAAKGDPRKIAVDKLAAADDAAGRVGTSAQQTAEIRRRLTEQIEAMRAEYIDNPKRRRRR